MKEENKYWESVNEAIPIQSRTVLNEYLMSLKLENKAESTITKYRMILERFLRECPVLVESLTSEDVLNWITAFSKGKKAKTVELVISTLSVFFKFCLSEEHVEDMLMKKRWRPKIPQALPKYLTEPEYVRVKREAETFPIRDRALVLFLFSSGCRVSEVSNLNRKNIDLENRTAKVRGKGKKIRYVHFSEECGLMLKAYLQTRTDQEEALFLNRFGERLHIAGIYRITAKLGKRAGLQQSLHPHTFRHTFATNMLARGADLEFIADEMGHDDLNTTRIYARIPTEDMILRYQNIMG